MRIGTACVTAVLSLAACKGKSEPAPTARPSAIPRVHVSAQPADPAAALASAKPAVETDGAERAVGAKMHAAVNQKCSDRRQCMFDQCAAQCTQWMKETHDAGAYRGPNHKNQIYINCTGSCMSGKAQP